MKRFQNTLLRIWNDLLEGKNLEIYFFALVALSVIVLDLGGNVIVEGVKLDVIIALLGLLVFSLSKPPQQADDFIYFRGSQYYDEIRRVITTSQDELYYLTRSGRTVCTMIPELERIIKDRSCHVKIMICDPDETTVNQILFSEVRAKDMDDVAIHINSTLRQMQYMHQRMAGSPHRGSLEVRTIKFLPAMSIVLADPETQEGQGYILWAAFREMSRNAPSLKINKTDHAQYIDHFRQEFERYWSAGTVFPLENNQKDQTRS